MDYSKLLRTLVVAEIILTVGGVICEFLLQGSLPEQLQVYLAAQSEAPLDRQELMAFVLALPLLVATVAAWIGILRFWKFAPTLYLGSSIGTVVVLLLTGPTVQTAFGTAIDTASSIVGGVILGLLYFSELRGRYGRLAPHVSVPGGAA